MIEFTPSQMKKYLTAFVTAGLTSLSIAMFGAAGIGKSSITEQVTVDNKIGFVDFRLGQIVPTDLRGIPFPEHDKGQFVYLAPSSLPRVERDGERGILFLDEFNMASPALMGIAQELILDRRIGDYRLPDGWIVVAAMNEKSDGAAVNTIPGPVSNRFLNFKVVPSIDDFTNWAIADGVDERIIAFLRHRPELLHRYQLGQMAWPSPRTWKSCDKLIKLFGVENSDLLAPSVGEGAIGEFEAYISVYQSMPNIADILEKGENSKEGLSNKLDVRAAVITALAIRQSEPQHFTNAYLWLSKTSKRSQEWTTMYFGMGLQTCLKIKGGLKHFLKASSQNEEIKKIIALREGLSDLENSFVPDTSAR